MATFLQHPDRDPAAKYGWQTKGGNFVDVFSVDVPDDFTGEDRARVAFNEAEEMSQWYFLPCNWEAIDSAEIGGTTVLVKRTRNNRKPK